jgi:hypothetical protein
MSTRLSHLAAAYRHSQYQSLYELYVARVALIGHTRSQSSACTADDFQRHTTLGGDFRGVNTEQTVHVQVIDIGSGQPQTNASVAFTVTRPNAQ